MANFILNKGGAGASISRSDTILRLEPIMRALSEINLYYDTVARTASHEDISGELDRMQRISLMDAGKLSESVLSAGGVPYNATDLEPENYKLEGADDEMLEVLRERERTFLDEVDAEMKVRHHIRTRAILMNVQTHSQERLNYLDGRLRELRRQG